MENVVYILGAGFSAPLGLPVMNNFLEKAKELHDRDAPQFEHFEKVFQKVKDMAYLKNFYESDLFNIENILSILDMDETLAEEASEKTEFIKFLKETIINYTPPIEGITTKSNNWWNEIITSKWKPYSHFVLALLGLKAKVHGALPASPERIEFTRMQNESISYSVVTLNYDLVLETIPLFLTEHYKALNDLKFERKLDEQFRLLPNRTYLSKLHGSIDTTIVPPTYNKNLINEDIKEQWRIAIQLLTEANHIRILGYSLPITDSYIKFLLQNAVVNSSISANLKRIDVICQDLNNQGVPSRYGNFIKYKNYRFCNNSIENYLSKIAYVSHSTLDDTSNFIINEEEHNKFMG
jgi:hypothetical protein